MIEPFWIGIAGIVMLVFLISSGVYIAVALGLVGVIGIIAIIDFSPAMSLLASTWFHYGTTYFFIIIPLFIAMGFFSAQAGVSRDLYDALSKWIGQIRGGLGLATIGAQTIFGALTGSSMVTAIVFAKVSVPEMRRLGYDPKLAYGLVSAGGALGMMIPPSVMAVIYALITEQSIAQLLLAGIGPGIVLAFCLGMGLVLLLTLRPSLGPPKEKKGATWRERFVALPKMWPALLVALILIGGMYTGIFTETEAAGIGTFVLVVLFLVVRRFSRESWQALGVILRDTVSLTGMVLLIMTSGQVFARMLVLSGLGTMFTDYIISLNLPPMGFVLSVVALYFFLGCLIDSPSIVVVTVPLLYPVAEAYRLDQIWFAMVLILSTQIGNITPPVGLNIFAVKGVAEPDISLEDIFRGVLPFFFMMCAALAVVIAFPSVSTWIPYHILQR
jgi:tripartite ATP-independent transporter DctM subunit